MEGVAVALTTSGQMQWWWRRRQRRTLWMSGGVKNASHLLKYDSMLWTFKADVKIVDNETISVDGKLIKVVSSRDPLKFPWAELGIGIVIERTKMKN